MMSTNYLNDVARTDIARPQTSRASHRSVAIIESETNGVNGRSEEVTPTVVVVRRHATVASQSHTPDSLVRLSNQW